MARRRETRFQRIAFLHTVEDVVRHLGGVYVVAKLTKRGTNAVHNWRALGRFSARTHEVMTRALAREGAVAPHELWQQDGLEQDAA